VFLILGVRGLKDRFVTTFWSLYLTQSGHELNGCNAAMGKTSDFCGFCQSRVQKLLLQNGAAWKSLNEDLIE
jgi:hypothetical protein